MKKMRISRRRNQTLSSTPAQSSDPSRSGSVTTPKLLALASLAILSACGDRDAPLNPGLPGIVVEQLPLGVSLDTVGRDTNGCFFYSQNGSVFVVTDDLGAPICLP